MGQMEVLEAIERLGFTTLKELKEEVTGAERAISHALTKLVKWNEIETLTFGVRQVYFSERFSIQLENERKTLDQI